MRRLLLLLLLLLLLQPAGGSELLLHAKVVQSTLSRPASAALTLGLQARGVGRALGPSMSWLPAVPAAAGAGCALAAANAWSALAAL